MPGGALVATWPENRLLPEVRRLLDGADEALLCVAFANQQGVALLERPLRQLGDRCRLLATTSFGQTTSAALDTASRHGVQVRILDPTRGTYHPKLYLARHGRARSALVGSANLTSGLICNTEVALLVNGGPTSTDAWALGEAMWARADTQPWTGSGPEPVDLLDQELFARLRAALLPGMVVATVDRGATNRVTDLSLSGFWVETDRTVATGSGPQLVPAWMVQLAYDALAADGRLTNRYLLADDGLNVKRSSFVCALLARLPEVRVASRRPIELVLASRVG